MLLQIQKKIYVEQNKTEMFWRKFVYEKLIPRVDEGAFGTCAWLKMTFRFLENEKKKKIEKYICIKLFLQ